MFVLYQSLEINVQSYLLVSHRGLLVASTFNPSSWDLMPLIPALGKRKQEVIWLDGRRNIRQTETGAHPFSV